MIDTLYACVNWMLAGIKMIKNSIALLFLLMSLNGVGQTLDDFKAAFEQATRKDFSEEQLNQMFRTYSRFLTPHSDITQLTANIQGDPIPQYPLADFRKEKLYQENINNLINSRNANHRILAYLVITGTGDKSFESALLKKLETETDKGNLIWAGMALLYLNTVHTTPLFDFLVKNETFGDAHMLPLYVRLNKDSLQQTAYRRIRSDNAIARVLAANILSKTELNSRTEQLLKEAVRNWDINIKGYAIFSIKELQIGDLLREFKPLLDSSQTRRVALEALANSPTKEDREYLFNLVEQQDTVSAELLDCFLQSINIGNVRYWLRLLYTKPVPRKYIFFVNDQPLLTADEILPDLHTALEKITDPEVLHELVRALAGRTDDKSVNAAIALLKHDDSDVRYWAAWTLRSNTSPQLIQVLPGLLSNPVTRTVALVDVAIDNNLDTLQNVFENIYTDNPDFDWKRSCIRYFSTFPRAKYNDVFKTILEDEKGDFSMKRDAALGLGRLHSEESVDLIVKVCEKESIDSDLNAHDYLIALEMIKGNKAKKAIEKYANSREQPVRKLVTEILAGWEE